LTLDVEDQHEYRLLSQVKLALVLNYWTLILWPLVTAGAVTYFGRNRLLKRRLFFSVAALMCYGAIFLAGLTHAYWVLPLEASSPSDRLVATVVSATLGMIVVGIVFSILPLLFLYRAWRDFSRASSISTSNKALERP
jgi:hypothetical protein